MGSACDHVKINIGSGCSGERSMTLCYCCSSAWTAVNERTQRVESELEETV